MDDLTKNCIEVINGCSIEKLHIAVQYSNNMYNSIQQRNDLSKIDSLHKLYINKDTRIVIERNFLLDKLISLQVRKRIWLFSYWKTRTWNYKSVLFRKHLSAEENNKSSIEWLMYIDYRDYVLKKK